MKSLFIIALTTFAFAGHAAEIVNELNSSNVIKLAQNDGRIKFNVSCDEQSDCGGTLKITEIVRSSRYLTETPRIELEIDREDCEQLKILRSLYSRTAGAQIDITYDIETLKLTKFRLY